MWRCPKERAIKIFKAIDKGKSGLPFASASTIYSKNSALEDLSRSYRYYSINADILYLIRKGYLEGEKVDYMNVHPDFVGQEYGNLEITPEGMNYWEEGNTEQESFLHPEIREHCLPLYQNANYKKCIEDAFGVVRSAYKEKFNGEKVPENFSNLFHIPGAFGTPGSKEDQNFQKGCLRTLYSINSFRNDIEHGKKKRNDESEASESDAMHYMYLSSLALHFLDKMKKHPNKLHPVNRNDYKNEKMSGLIKFDHSNNNGEYQIGNGVNIFTIRVSSCGDDSLYLYNDPSDIRGVGLIEDIHTPLKDISTGDLVGVDMSSRFRVIHINNVGVLLNKDGVYALLRLKTAIREKSAYTEIEYYICK